MSGPAGASPGSLAAAARVSRPSQAATSAPAKTNPQISDLGLRCHHADVGESEPNAGQPTIDHDPEGDARWRAVLTGDYDANPALRGLRPLFRHLPSDPRCKLCFAPYGAPFGPIIRRLGFGPWDKNPSLCGTCLRLMERHLGGAEVELTMLFADLRGSTELAERIPAASYRGLVNSFYAIAARDIKDCGGVINKYLGDGVFALFVPGFSGPDHAQQGIEAARHLLRHTDATLELPVEASPLPLGIGVHTGTAYVGVMGKAGDLLDFTALGDVVNLTQRLSSAAAGREFSSVTKLTMRPGTLRPASNGASFS
jgi:adenylate cyclase